MSTAPVLSRHHDQAMGLTVLGGLSASATALAAAPLLMPAGYSWVANTTSESAAQGVPGGWLARLGFVLFGVSVILLAILARVGWGRWATALHGGFGVLMVAAAVFSHRPWLPGQPADTTEDLLHSVAATGMGFVFIGAVVATAVLGRHGGWRPLDSVAMLAAVAVPLGMSAWPAAGGLLQRLMFAVAYVWYAVEAVRVISARRVISGGGPAGLTTGG